MIISYGIRKGKTESTIIIKEEVKSHHLYYNHKLPIAINAEDYGPITANFNNYYWITLKRNTSLVITTEINIKGVATQV
jgi:hypothetical protein